MDARRLVAATATVVAVALVNLSGVGSPASAAGPNAPVPTGTFDHQSRLLAAPSHGREAVSRLGDDLAVAAARNQMSSSRLARLLTTDPTAWLNRSGQLYFVEPTLAPQAATGTQGAAAYPLNQTFTLHSKPDATKTIYLDFDGQQVANSIWNDNSSLADGFYRGWTTDSDASTFNETERAVIQSVWQRVAEDYAAFDVDVTTADPGSDALTRSDISDQTFGIRVLFTPSEAAHKAVCGGTCGGVATVGTFDAATSVADYVQPAWIFPQGLGPNNAKFMAEAAAHEVGHTLGLSHDGTSSLGYYTGQGSWAPIMGVGYAEPITQWSNGDYSDANNREDDYAVIASNGLAERPDEAGGAVGSAAPMTGAKLTGYISDAQDQDVYAVDRTCATTFTALARPAPTSPDLDIELTLLNQDGAVVETSNPASGGTGDVATGLSAGLSPHAGPGIFYLRVDGAGSGDPASTGYSDYGSVGRYRLVLSTSCPSGVPGRARSVTASRGNASAAVGWAPPSNAAGTGVTGYRIRAYSGQGTPLGAVSVKAAARSYTWTGLTNGNSYTFDVSAVAGNVTGPAATTTAVTPARTPGRPGIGGASNAASRSLLTASVSWSAPSSDGGAALTAYVVHAVRLDSSGAVVQRVGFSALPPETLRHAFDLPRAGTWRFSVRAVNKVGAGRASPRSNAVRAG